MKRNSGKLSPPTPRLAGEPNEPPSQLEVEEALRALIDAVVPAKAPPAGPKRKSRKKAAPRGQGDPSES
jgi:hypothetical protein